MQSEGFFSAWLYLEQARRTAASWMTRRANRRARTARSNAVQMHRSPVQDQLQHCCALTTTSFVALRCPSLSPNPELQYPDLHNGPSDDAHTSSARSGDILTHVICLSPAYIDPERGSTDFQSSSDSPSRLTQCTCPDAFVCGPQEGVWRSSIRRSHMNACRVRPDS